MSTRRTVAICANTSWYIWNFRRNVIRAFTEEGWAVVVIALTDESTERLCAMPGVSHIPWQLSLNDMKLVEEAQSLFRLMHIFHKLRPDVILNNGIKANVYGGLAGRLLRIPYINNVSGLGTRMSRGDRTGKGIARLYAFASSGAYAMLFQNDSDMLFLKHYGLAADVPVHKTMGSGVDLDHFACHPLPDSTVLNFVFIGRLQTDKGIEDFVEAARRLIASGIDARFTVVGSTKRTNTGAISDQMLTAWKDERFFDFVGLQSDIRPFLQKAHILVLPSHGGEGMPKVLLEAAACGRPVITSNVPGCKDAVIDGKTGWLHQARDVGSLTEAMTEATRLDLSRLQKMGTANRNTAERNYSDTVISDLTLSLARSSVTS